MLEKLLGGLTLAEQSVPNGLVVAMGIGTVFVGLIAIVIICKIISLILAPKTANTETTKEVAAPVTENSAVIENRQEIIAAVAAVIAEELGTEVEALKIHSFKKI